MLLLRANRAENQCCAGLRMALVSLQATFAVSATPAEASRFAQQLVTEALAEHPEVAHMVMHITPPHRPDTENLIIASSVGRIGKLADDDDLRIMRTGAPEAVISKSGDRFNVSLPFLDAAGNTIGVLAIGFPFRSGDDPQALKQQAEQLRDALRKRIPTVETLFGSD